MASLTPESSAAAPRHAVNVVSSTFARESHDLFDFESDHIDSDTFSVQRSTTIVRSSIAVSAQEEGTAAPSGAESLLRVAERGGSYWVDRATMASPQRLWTVVRDEPGSGHCLAKDDVFRLGRFRFRVRQIVTGHDGGPQEPDLGLEDTCVACAEDGTEGKACRICLMEGSSEDDPLLRPCQCRGSIERVHLGCLREWTKSRLNLDESPLGSFSFKPLPCELCKTAFPTHVTSSKGERAQLMELPKTRPPYIVLETVVGDRREGGRTVHVMSLAQKPLIIGRGHESTLRISDVSISRCHASIAFLAGQCFLQDNRSKFGTLVAMRRPSLLEVGRPLSVQIGRTVLSFSISPAPHPSLLLPAAATGGATFAAMAPSGSYPMSTTPKSEAELQQAFVGPHLAIDGWGDSGLMAMPEVANDLAWPATCVRYRMSI